MHVRRRRSGLLPKKCNTKTPRYPLWLSSRFADIGFAVERQILQCDASELSIIYELWVVGGDLSRAPSRTCRLSLLAIRKASVSDSELGFTVQYTGKAIDCLQPLPFPSFEHGVQDAQMPAMTVTSHKAAKLHRAACLGSTFVFGAL